MNSNVLTDRWLKILNNTPQTCMQVDRENELPYYICTCVEDKNKSPHAILISKKLLSLIADKHYILKQHVDAGYLSPSWGHDGVSKLIKLQNYQCWYGSCNDTTKNKLEQHYQEVKEEFEKM